ncbi:MAG TPA: hypothetical protein ENI80_05690 [Acidiferrobacteraceae bacterium]|nr:hypothetical protein [Acidiferrobacteraceae bacterium]
MVKNLARMITQPNERLVVRQPTPLRLKLLFAVLGLVTIYVLATQSYQYGLEQAGYSRSQSVREQAALDLRIRDLESDNAQQRELLARVQRQLQIDSTAYKEVDISLEASTHKIADLREELNFYRNIIAPGNKSRGLQIQNLRIESAGIRDQYRYKLVLIQAFNHKRMVTGRVGFTVLGVLDGVRKSIKIERGANTPMGVNFRYFQNIEGILILPSGFKPLQVQIGVYIGGQAVPKVEESFPWTLT